MTQPPRQLGTVTRWPSLIRLRQDAADEIERLLFFLDATDGDTDLEADEPTDAEILKAAGHYGTHHDDDEDGADREPALGFVEPIITGDEMDGFPWPYRSKDAAQHITAPESTHDLEDDGGDLEPSLCGVTAQALLSIGACVEDGEDNDDDHDDDLEREPSLGWTPQEAAGGSFYCGIAEIDRVDLEEQCEDEGDKK